MKPNEKLIIAMQRQKITQTELARRTGQAQQNVSRKLNSNSFGFDDFEKYVNAIGCALEINVILPNGEKI